MGLCRGCAADDECSSLVCDRAAGSCVDPALVLYASSSGSATSSCSATQPCSITRAISLADSNRTTVKMLPGTYTASFTVDGKVVVIHGYGATLNAAAAATSIGLDNGARLQLLGLTVVNLSAGMTAIDCFPSTSAAKPFLEMDEVSVDAVAVAVLAYPCTATIARSRLKTRNASFSVVYALPTSSVTIDRSVLDGGNGVVAEGQGSVVRVTNSIIMNQTGDRGAFAGTNVFGQGVGSVSVSFSTVINSQVKCGSGVPRCAGGTDVGSCVDSSIIFNGLAGAPADTVQPGGCTASYSLIFPQSTPLTGGNNKYGVNPTFNDFAGADYHLANNSMAIDAADPAATNFIDFDGVQRPQGTRSDIGAFEFKP